ncbi:MAG: hypothetical protein HUJ95_04360 [Bacteroidales bacterium]|nr:hypothetical protein [Bacteroidales bacterium]
MTENIIIAVFCALTIVYIRIILDQMGIGLDCLRVPRQNVALESIVFKSRKRTGIAVFLLIPVIIIWANLNLHLYTFTARFEPDYISPCLALATYMLLRQNVHFFLRNSSGAQTVIAAKRSTWTISIFYCVFFSILWVLLGIAHLERKTLIIISTSIFGLFFLLNLWLETQILRTYYSKIKVFLYLCGLEIIPVAITAGSLFLL